MLTAGVMSHGGIEFKTKGRDDQAECEAIGPDTFPGKVAGALQIDAFQMIKAYCKPRIKVGTEWVVKGQTCEQVRTLIFDIKSKRSILRNKGNQCCWWNCKSHLRPRLQVAD